jgi:hypothetical protein
MKASDSFVAESEFELQAVIGPRDRPAAAVKFVGKR